LLAGALADYAEAVKLAPRDAGLLLERANFFARGGDHRRMMADCTAALAADPALAEAYRLRGRAHERLKEAEAALADYAALLKLRPGDAAAHAARAGVFLYARNDPAAAIAEYGQAIRLDPSRADYRGGRAHAHYERREYERALADYDEAVRLNPGRAPGTMPLFVVEESDLGAALAYFGRGLVYEAKKLDRKALEDYSRAIELNPGAALFYGARAKVYQRLGEEFRAAEDEEQERQLRKAMPPAAP
jgi:tetratricopeptide (TPR) repeat protein